MYTIEELRNYCNRCRKCQLSKTRTNTVFGEGNINADIMFVGEGPGYNEDIQGRPFVGKAGQLLDKMIAAIKLQREEVYITNIVKCRPPENRNPLDEECNACIDYLRWQVKIINPKIIVCLGSISSKKLIDPTLSITRQRGTFLKKGDIFFMPTYHPSYLLRNEDAKKDAWNDFKMVQQKIMEIQSS